MKSRRDGKVCLSPLEAAEQKGARAFHQGLPETACPYLDKRKQRTNGVTFARAFRNAWLRGYRSSAR